MRQEDSMFRSVSLDWIDETCILLIKINLKTPDNHYYGTSRPQTLWKLIRFYFVKHLRGRNYGYSASRRDSAY